jgi:hypothetical protein
MKKLKIAVVMLIVSLVIGYKLDIVKAYTAPPCLESEVIVDTGNGFGSSNTKIRRFTNIDVNTGSDITYVDSSTDGGTFTINTNGMYSISYTDYRGDTGDSAAITVNTTSISSGVGGNANIPCLFSPNPTNVGSCSAIVILSATDIVRATWSTAGFSGGDVVARFVITKIR